MEPLLPRNKKAGRPPQSSKRQLIDGIRLRTRVGCPWRDIPPQYGSWSAVYGSYRRWQRDGSWLMIVKLLQAFADCGGRIRGQVSVDSTIMRAHPHAAGARRDGGGQAEPPGGCGDPEPADHGLGWSRRGWSTKLHLACEQGCRVLAMLVTAGQAGDSPHFAAVLDAIDVAKTTGGRSRVRPDRVLADKAYSSRANRDWLRRSHIKATIPVPADQAAHRRNRGRGGGRPPAFDPVLYRDRKRGRTGHQPAQTESGRRHQVRQARRPLPGYDPYRRNQPMDTTRVGAARTGRPHPLRHRT
ncbi:IS5 family transposase [Nocardia sp. NPDC004711]